MIQYIYEGDYAVGYEDQGRMIMFTTPIHYTLLNYT